MLQKVDFMEKESKILKYYVHYYGWNKSWDEWVPGARMLKHCQSNMARKKDLERAHVASVKAKKAKEAAGGGAGSQGAKRKSGPPVHEVVPSPKISGGKKTNANALAKKQKQEVNLLVPNDTRGYKVYILFFSRIIPKIRARI